MTGINPDLLKQAAELNIEVTGNATEEALQAAIDEVLAEDASSKPRDPLDHDGDGKKGGSKPKAKPAAAKTYPYCINRDFWDEHGERHRKGTIVEMTADDAQDGLESGALSRVK